VTYEYDSVGNRTRRVIEATDAAGERAVKVTNYTYDERDRLVAERSTGATLYLAAAAGDPRQLATLQRPSRQRVFEHALSGLFGLATLGLLLGFVWPRSTSGRLGQSAQRKQLLTSAVAIFLVALMGVDLSTLADLNVHAWQRAALADTMVVDEVLELLYQAVYRAVVGVSCCVWMLGFVVFVTPVHQLDALRRCRSCGYDLKGCVSIRCPECGAVKE
jgi:YD repeat-containing protein